MNQDTRFESDFLKHPSDLSNLELIDRSAVTDLISSLANKTGRKQMIAIGTGGTLSMSEQDGIRTPDLDIDGIFKHLDPTLYERFSINGLNAFHIDSAQMDYRHVRDLAIAMCYIWHNTPVPIAGFLILHGTDTLAFSGATLSLIMGRGLPFSIVITAAQKPVYTPLSDAPKNITNALYTLDALHDHDMAEVINVMGDTALLSSSAMKVHDLHANALSAPMHPPVIDFTQLGYPLKMPDWLKPRRSNEDFHPTLWTGTYGHTLVLQSYLGLSPEMVAYQIRSDHVRALMLYSYGAGTLYDRIMNVAMHEAKFKDLPVFVISPVHSEYKVMYASAKEMIDRGAIPLHMTMPAALAKIEIALRLHEGKPDALAAFMQDNYVGEIPPNA